MKRKLVHSIIILNEDTNFESLRVELRYFVTYNNSKHTSWATLLLYYYSGTTPFKSDSRRTLVPTQLYAYIKSFDIRIVYRILERIFKLPASMCHQSGIVRLQKQRKRRILFCCNVLLNRFSYSMDHVLETNVSKIF